MIYHHPRPGEILREMVFTPMGISVTEGADRLDITRNTLSRVLNGKAGISPNLALRLERAGVSSARFWMNLQMNYDLWYEKQKNNQHRVRPLNVETSTLP